MLLEERLTGVCLIPGAGEAVYATETVRVREGLTRARAENVNNVEGRADVVFGSRFTGESRLRHEIISGALGAGIELVLDKDLSWDLSRCYGFINENAISRFERKTELRPAAELRRRGNDSPVP